MTPHVKQFVRTKCSEPLIHLIVWSGFVLYLWHNAYTLGPFRKQEGSIYLPLLWSAGFNVALFYVNAMGLIPRLFDKRLYKIYTLWAIALYAAVVGANAICDQLYSLSLFSTEKESFWSDVVMNIQSKTVILSLSIGYGLTRQWVQNQKIQQEIVKAELTTRLKYLKAQINPHFLFNTLNMAYASATKSKDPVTADIIEKLSELMRYVLYESEEEKVALEKEIRYIDNLVRLQIQRLSPELASQVHYQVEGNWHHHKVAPLILIPFIENVFKHGLFVSRKSGIYISIALNGNVLTLETRNNKSQRAIQTDKSSGIGLKNARERLLLLYPNQHALEIDDTGASFHVKLQIEITQKP